MSAALVGAIGCGGSSSSGPGPSSAGASSGGSAVGGQANTGGTLTVGLGGSGAGGQLAGVAGAGGVGIQLAPKPFEKLDLLFVVDNSLDMAPSQALLAKGADELLVRLTNPYCVQVNGGQRERPINAQAPCASGMVREFAPVTDLHVGVITSSLGGFGSNHCTPADSSWDPRKDDGAHLMPTVVPTLSSYANRGFWVWDPASTQVPAGESNLPAFVQSVHQGIEAVGNTGCGFEAPLEAWYRFLVSPDPFQSITKVGFDTVQTGVDEAVLTQRSHFLRDDSHVSIVLISTEDDCSIQDQGLGWLVGSTTLEQGGMRRTLNMPRPTSTCDTAPNSACCRPCTMVEAAPPAGCAPVGTDPACLLGTSLAPLSDAANLRCFDQKRRFGVELLQPIARYSAGLRAPQVPDRTGALKPNGLFKAVKNGKPLRDPSMVLLTSIVGVPWTAIAADPRPEQNQVTYLIPQEFVAQRVWDNILGDETASVPPKDPLMRGSIPARSGVSPRSNIALAPATSTNPLAAPNGHEFNVIATDDLQYSCLFEMPTPVNCLISTACSCGSPPYANIGEQEIRAQVLSENRPTCNPPAGGPAETTQYFSGAYPAPRHLSLLKAQQDQARLGSVCPKFAKEDAMHSGSDPSFGYNPALSQVADWVGGLGN